MARKSKLENIDGFGPKDAKRLRTAIRQVWSWNYARKLCIQRATDTEGFGYCENKTCRKKVPKLYADHKKMVGKFDPHTFIVRMFVQSTQLQALCKKCHDKKTRLENKLANAQEVSFL